jgi:hypothetical protein
MGRIGGARSAFYLTFLAIAVLALSDAGCGKDVPQVKRSSIGLSAYFVDIIGNPIDDPTSNSYAQSHLHVEGEVYKDGAPVSKGAVNITVVAKDLKFNQSVFVPLDEKGKFTAPESAFHSVRPGTALSITADVTSPELHDAATLELNSETPVTKWITEAAITIFVFALVWVFIFSFTGRKSFGKNRLAIQFSYVIIMLFLAVPIVAPVMMFRWFPDAVDAMIGYPAGLVVTCFGEPPREYPQWALNIGGYSHVSGDECQSADRQNAKLVPSDRNTVATTPPRTPPTTDSATKNVKQKDQPVSRATPSSNTKATAAAPSVPARAGQRETSDTSRSTARKITIPSESVPGTNATQSGSETVSGSPAPPAGEGKTIDRPSPSGSTGTDADTGTKPEEASDLTDDVLHPERLNPSVVRVRGGMVIPLYVIVLSVIGGAINMTRKVPGFQKEGEDSIGQVRTSNQEQQDAAIPEAEQQADAIKASSPPAHPLSQTLEEQAAQVDAELDPLIAAQVKRNSETTTQLPKLQLLVQKMQDLFAASADAKLLGFQSFDEWYLSRPKLREVLGSNWRVELLNQYMYLISAPFLAIVTYYIIDLLGLSKPGVLVVMSFSVGLISEKIVTWILGIATGYMQTPKKA